MNVTLNNETQTLVHNMYLSTILPMFIVECGYCRTKLKHPRWTRDPRQAVWCSQDCAEKAGVFDG